jgi:hypothetical protein
MLNSICFEVEGTQQLATTINQRACAASVAMFNTPYFVSKAQTALNGAAMAARVNPNALQGRAHSIGRYSSFPGLGRLGAMRVGAFLLGLGCAGSASTGRRFAAVSP